MMIGKEMPDGLAHQVLGLEHPTPAHAVSKSNGQ